MQYNCFQMSLYDFIHHRKCMFVSVCVCPDVVTSNDSTLFTIHPDRIQQTQWPATFTAPLTVTPSLKCVHETNGPLQHPKTHILHHMAEAHLSALITLSHRLTNIRAHLGTIPLLFFHGPLMGASSKRQFSTITKMTKKRAKEKQ